METALRPSQISALELQARLLKPEQRAGKCLLGVVPGRVFEVSRRPVEITRSPGKIREEESRQPCGLAGR